MALNIRKVLAELMGVEKIADADIRNELDELKIDNRLDALTKEGHLAANPETQALARKAISTGATPDEIEQLLRTPRPAPAGTTIVEPPAGPGPGEDPTEAAIQAEMAKSGTRYDQAASVVAAGAMITPTGAENAI